MDGEGETEEESHCRVSRIVYVDLFALCVYVGVEGGRDVEIKWQLYPSYLLAN